MPAIADAEVRRYVVRVYRGPSYYPDRTLQTHSRGRADRRMEQIRAEGFTPKLIAVSARR
jgi:hypothetical protein